MAKDNKECSKYKGVVVYIHGLFGSYKEANEYSYLSDKYDVVGLDYTDSNPWELKEYIRKEFIKITKGYDEVVVIANSIGAFYAYTYLSDFNIKQAFFISPIASMYQIIINLMLANGISEKELEEKKYITCQDDTVLSYDFYKYVLDYKDNWNVPTEILYGEKDELVYIENIVDFLKNHPNARLTIKQDSKHYFHSQEEKESIKNWILRSI